MPVDSARNDYEIALPIWRRISDCYAGEQTIRGARERYLPRPNPDDPDANTRYEQYILRASFLNVVRRTLKGLVGLCFRRDPNLVAPIDFQPIFENADGTGKSIIQQAKLATRFVIGFGRAGMFVDYPNVPKPTTKKQLADGEIRPTVKIYNPEKVINWQTAIRGGLRVLSLVVIKEQYLIQSDGFTHSYGDQYRVLTLEDLLPTTGDEAIDNAPDVGTYMVRIFRKNVGKEFTRDSSGNIIPDETYRPTDGDGKPWTVIPFIFIGCEDNDPDIDDAPMGDLANVNIAHWHNSADYEESVYIIGQPTPYFTGMTELWYNKVLQGKVQLGSRRAIPLPPNSAAGLLQALPNSMAHEAMLHKEAQMIAIGANLIDSSKAPRTATESLIDDTNESSVLDTCGNNVSDAFQLALHWCAMYMGLDVPDSPGLIFNINTDSNLVNMTPQERQQLMMEWQGSAITWDEYRNALAKAGIATTDNATALTLIKENPPPPPSTMPKPVAPTDGNNNNEGGDPAINSQGSGN